MINTEHKYFVPAAVFVCLVLLVFAVLLSQSRTTSVPSTPGSLQPGQAGSAPIAAPASAPMAPPVSADGLLHYVAGFITAVGTNSITISGQLPGNLQTTSIVVNINSATVITEQVQTDAKTYQKEMQAFQKKLASEGATSTSTPPSIPPPPFTAKPISAADLAVGMGVLVTPVANTKQDATTIGAVTILIQSVATPAPAAK